jgi:hypothetical protein
MIIVAILFFILLVVVGAYLAVFLGGIIGGVFGIRKAKREAAAHGMSLKEYRAMNKREAAIRESMKGARFTPEA